MFTLPCYFVRNLKEEQIQIRFNLVVAIAIAQITFLVGIEASALEVPVQPWSVVWEFWAQLSVTVINSTLFT